MSSERTPYIAIIGGFFQLSESNPAKFEAAKQVAREIGGELAKAGMGLVVYLSNEQSLEPHVVAGFAAAVGPGTRENAIRVRYAQSQEGEVVFPAQNEVSTKGLFHRKVFPSNDWTTPFYRSLAEADGVDGVLLVAGGQSTLIAGQIALARGLPVFAVNTFNGTAATIWNELSLLEPGYPSLATHGAASCIKWLKDKCLSKFRTQELLHARSQEAERMLREKSVMPFAVVSLLILLAVLGVGIARAPKGGLFVALTFLGLLAGGATGALVRSVFWGDDRSSPTRSLYLGLVAGLVAGIASLIPQYIGAPEILDASTIPVAKYKIQLIAAVIVAISAGVGFDTILERLREAARTTKVTPPERQP